MTLETGHDFISHVTRFCRLLRTYGMLIGPQEITDAVQAVAISDVMDRYRVYLALRCVVISRYQEINIFDELFERFWYFKVPPHGLSPISDMPKVGEIAELRPASYQALAIEHDDNSLDTLVQVTRTGSSPIEVILKRDLVGMPLEEMSELSRIATRMVKALAVRPGRRRKPDKRKGLLDLRRTLRLNLAIGGDPIRLSRVRRVPRIPRLLVLLDVSGSMDRYSRLLMQLIFAVGQHTGRVETFVFSTSLTRITRQLQVPSFREALSRVSEVVNHWSGGTRIGESIGRLNSEYEALQDRYTTVLLLSDGWETGDVAKLAAEMRKIHKRVRTVVWLNPLLGTRDFRPLARGLQAVMPYVDHFLSARDISHLKRLPELLRA